MKDPSPKFHRRFKLQYGLLIGLRLFIILTSTSFIHPDEHFQNTEIAIEDVFRPTYDHHHPDHRTWEWDPSRLSDRSIGRGPVRSIVPIWLTSHLGLLILKRLHALGFIRVTTRSLFIVPRLVLFLLTLPVDRLIWKLARSPTVQWTYATSLYSLLFVCRTFSNSLESILFTIIFTLTLSILNHDPRGDHGTSSRTAVVLIAVWTCLNILTVWVRISYICFALPIMLTIAHTRLFRSLDLFMAATFSALTSLTLLTSLDSIYFDLWPTVTPISLLIYNLDRQNLAEHGTHPYLLHLLINGPIIFGPSLWFTSWYRIWNQLTSKSIIPIASKLSLASLISGTLLLSIQPHQEPRFLLPLVLPLIILSSPSKKSRGRSAPRSRVFWISHLLHSLITVILFGYLHQGGLRSVLEALPTETKLIMSYKTFDIPSSLITTTHDQIQEIHNFRGSLPTESKLIERLCHFAQHYETGVILITPRWSISSYLENHLESKFVSRIPHLDLDRLDLLWNAGISKSGLALYQVDPQKISELC